MTSPKRSNDVSVGEYDFITGLTHITHQRGRLLFNMGAGAKKQQHRGSEALSIAIKPTVLELSTGTFTGLSLYPEEANYLLQRGALTIYHMNSLDKDTKELSAADFAAILASDARVSLSCLEVYTFLKDQQLHPRRCLELPTAPAGSESGRSIPRHMKESDSCDVAFDVWKSMPVNVPLPRQDAEHAAESPRTSTTKTKKQILRKKLMLVFRVAVCRYWDDAPSLRDFRQVLERSKARDSVPSSCSTSLTCDQVPVKLAVVGCDQSVLIFEISS